MRKLIITVLVFIIQLSIGQSNNDWIRGYGVNFSTYSGDTSFFGGEVEDIIWRIKKGNKLYEYYPNGNIQSISEIKLNRSFISINSENIERNIKEYILDGKSKIFYENHAEKLVAKGKYNNNEIVGKWKYYSPKGIITEISYPMLLWRRSDYYDTNNTIIKQIDRINTIDGTVEVKEVKFNDKGEQIIYNKTLFTKIYLKFTIEYMVIFFILMFIRIILNSIIYNRENNTNLSPIYFFAGPYVTKNYGHSLISVFTFWFSNYKDENKKMVYFSNTISIITLTLFFGVIIGLMVSGEI